MQRVVACAPRGAAAWRHGTPALPHASGWVGGVTMPTTSVWARAASTTASTSSSTPSHPSATDPAVAAYSDKARAEDARLRAAYDAPLDATAAAGGLSTEAAYRKRLLYRSKQRGWLEVDLLLGSWASAHLATLPAADLPRYDAILRMETVDLYNVLTCREPIPPAMDSPLFRRIVEFAKASPLGHASKEGYASVKHSMSN